MHFYTFSDDNDSFFFVFIMISLLDDDGALLICTFEINLMTNFSIFVVADGDTCVSSAVINQGGQKCSRMKRLSASVQAQSGRIFGSGGWRE